MTGGAARGRPVRVAMVGTFDVENLGDLLFPSVAHHELSARLGDVELELFSYRSLDPPSWPLKVRSVDSLGPRLAEFDALLVGGGHLVRGDEGVAPGYLPTSVDTSHPYGLWLTPTLLAAGAGVPVVWNAVGSIETVDEAVEPMVAAAIAAVDYLAVRDLGAARFVRSRCPEARPSVVPDTAFSIADVLEASPDATRGARVLLGALGLDGPYVVVQPSGLLAEHRDAVERACKVAADRGLVVVEVPCGPCHHDEPGRLGLSMPTAAAWPWPDPLVVAAILADAELVIASSLHAGIVAASCGVPLLRPRADAGSKYELLNALPGVHELLGDVADDAVIGVRARPSQDAGHDRLGGITGMLQSHWDEVARRAAGGRHGPRPAAVAYLDTLPDLLRDRAGAARRERDALVAAADADRRASAAAYEALDTSLGAQLDALRGVVEHQDELLRRRSIRLARAVADRTARWRRRARDGAPPADAT